MVDDPIFSRVRRRLQGAQLVFGISDLPEAVLQPSEEMWCDKCSQARKRFGLYLTLPDWGGGWGLLGSPAKLGRFVGARPFFRANIYIYIYISRNGGCVRLGTLKPGNIIFSGIGPKKSERTISRKQRAWAGVLTMCKGCAQACDRVRARVSARA